MKKWRRPTCLSLFSSSLAGCPGLGPSCYNHRLLTGCAGPLPLRTSLHSPVALETLQQLVASYLGETHLISFVAMTCCLCHREPNQHALSSSAPTRGKYETHCPAYFPQMLQSHNWGCNSTSRNWSLWNKTCKWQTSPRHRSLAHHELLHSRLRRPVQGSWSNMGSVNSWDWKISYGSNRK